MAMLRRAWLVVAFMVVLPPIVEPAKGVLLNYGESAVLPGTTLAQRPELAGTTAASNSYTLIGSETPGEFTAKLEFGVVREASGDLGFTYRVVGSTINTPLVWKVTVDSLPFSNIDADVLLDTPGVNSTIRASRDGNGVTTFSSTTALQPGESTKTLFIRLAGVRDFRAAGVLELTTNFGREPVPAGLGSPNGTFLTTGYAPIPEPATMGLVVIAAVGLGWRVRRR